MPSQRTVALSLDEETLVIWDSLPKGERSKRVREALTVANLTVAKDDEIENLHNQTMRHIRLIRQLKMSNHEIRHFGCMCVVGGISPDVEASPLGVDEE